MKKILLIITSLLLTSAFVGCSDNETTTWEDYEEWRNLNIKYVEEQAAIEIDGKGYYTRIVPQWNPGVYILIHYFNERGIVPGALTPLSTSYVSVKYKGMLYDGTPFDSSYLNTDSIFTTSLSGVITGWQIALQNMQVGDSVDVILPYQVGYGVSGSQRIPPYSTLKFGIKLVDIPYYEIRP